MDGVKKFKINFGELSKKEKLCFEKLILAAEMLVPLYLKQKNNKYPGANFYPHDAAKEEIQAAAKRNPAILSPYTFVERNKSGKLIAVPFNFKFKKELEEISKILEEAAKLSEDKNFSLYLKERAKDLLRDNYDRSNILWLKTERYKLGFVIGPFDRYLDKLFFKKRAYMAWVGILNEKETEEARKITSTILASKRKILPGAKKIDISKQNVRIDKTAIFSGLVADFMFTGNNLPSSADVDLIKKYGLVYTIFETSLDLKFKEQHYPTFKAVFAEPFQRKYSKKELYKGSLRCIISHEISHSLIRYQDVTKRLGELFPIIDELYAYVLGVKSFGVPFLKGMVSQKELEAILIMHLCRHFMWWSDLHKNPGVSHYATGSAIALNFYIKEEGLRVTENTIHSFDFSKLFICIDELSHILDYLLALGSYNETQKFIEKYSSFDVFKKFSPRLAKIPQKI